MTVCQEESRFSREKNKGKKRAQAVSDINDIQADLLTVISTGILYCGKMVFFKSLMTFGGKGCPSKHECFREVRLNSLSPVSL